MFKKIFVLILFFVFTAINIYATDDCSDVTCPDGWNLGQTGWVLLQLNDNPDIYCSAKVCYCYDLSEVEGPNFFVKKIIWAQDTCYQNHYQNIDYDILKESIILELIRIHQNQLDVIFCPNYNYQYSVELFTSFCYADYYYQGVPISIPCDGDGYCAQLYVYCWDNTQSPWVLKVKKSGPSIIYDNSECILPIGISADPNYEIMHPCISWCY